MKKLILILFLFSTTFSLYSQSLVQYESINLLDKEEDRSLPMPEGTKVFENNDGSYLVQLPEGFEYLYREIGKEEILTIASGSVTCTCTKGSGCHPVKAQGQYGCLMNGSCSNCSKGGIRNPQSGNEIEIVGIKSSEYSPLRLLSKRAVKSESMLDFLRTDNLPYFSNCDISIFNYDESKKAIDEYLSKMFSKEDMNKIKSNVLPSVEVEYIMADFYGNTIALIAPKNDIGDDLLPINRKWTCTCQVTGSCPDESTILYKVCNAFSCKSCKGAGIIKIENRGLDLEK
jgi:hypothetical protein